MEALGRIDDVKLSDERPDDTQSDLQISFGDICSGGCRVSVKGREKEINLRDYKRLI